MNPRTEDSTLHLADTVQGPVFRPGDPGYAQEARGFNLAVTHHPAVIVGVKSADDVRASVSHARAADLPVGVQATGHGAWSSQRGLLVSTRRMTGIDVNAAARTVRVEAGVRWGQVIDALARAGLAALNGSSPLVGVVGYTLGGGLGPLGRLFGYASDHVLEMQLVTPNGDVLTVSRSHHPELFSGVLGGKDGFGIVTALTFRTFPITRFFGGGLYFSGEHAGRVLHEWRRWLRDVPKEASTSIALLRMPDVPTVPSHLRGHSIIHLRAAHFGSRSEGESMADDLRRFAPAVVDTLAERPYSEIAEVHADGSEPIPFVESNILLRSFDEAAVNTLLTTAGPDSKRTETMLEVRHLGGALSDPPAFPSAVGNRSASFSLSSLSSPAAGGSDSVFRAMRPWTTGHRYVNFLGGSVGDAELAMAYDAPTIKRLRALKRQYDPRGIFRSPYGEPTEGAAGVLHPARPAPRLSQCDAQPRSSDQ